MAIRIAEVATPNPRDNEVLIRIHAASVTTTEFQNYSQYQKAATLSKSTRNQRPRRR